MKPNDVRENVFWLAHCTRKSGNTTALLEIALKQPAVIICVNNGACESFQHIYSKLYHQKFWLRIKLNNSFLFKAFGISFPLPKRAMFLSFDFLVNSTAGPGEGVLLRNLEQRVRGEGGRAKRAVFLDNSVLLNFQELLRDIERANDFHKGKADVEEILRKENKEPGNLKRFL